MFGYRVFGLCQIIFAGYLLENLLTLFYKRNQSVYGWVLRIDTFGFPLSLPLFVYRTYIQGNGNFLWGVCFAPNPAPEHTYWV